MPHTFVWAMPKKWGDGFTLQQSFVFRCEWFDVESLDGLEVLDAIGIKEEDLKVRLGSNPSAVAI